MKNAGKNQLFWLAVALAIATVAPNRSPGKLKREGASRWKHIFCFWRIWKEISKKDSGTWRFVLPNWWLSNTTFELFFTPEIGEDEPHLFICSISLTWVALAEPKHIYEIWKLCIFKEETRNPGSFFVLIFVAGKRGGGDIKSLWSWDTPWLREWDVMFTRLPCDVSPTHVGFIQRTHGLRL